VQIRDGERLYSASDLVGFLECEHLTTIALKDLLMPIPRAADDAAAVLIQQMGYSHEAAYLHALEASSLRIARIPDSGSPKELAELTLQAMRDGFDTIFQAALFVSPLYGRADFLRRVPGASSLGDYQYEVIDTKLGRSPKAKFIIQLCFYSHLVSMYQEAQPRAMSLVLGDGAERQFRYANYSYYFQQALNRFTTFIQTHPNDTSPERVAHCGICQWRDHCKSQWLAHDHNQDHGAARCHGDQCAHSSRSAFHPRETARAGFVAAHP
jgi:predicted RecB family nuclease